MRHEDYSKKSSILANQKIKERDYWLNKLSGDLVKTGFPGDNRNIDQNREAKETVKFKFTRDLYRKLMTLSNKSDYRIHIILAAGVFLLLRKYTGNKDIIVGVPIYRQKIEGDFINTVLAVRIQVTDNLTVKELILQAAKTIVEANDNQNYPMESLLYKLNIPYSQQDFPLFDTAVLLENIHEKKYLNPIPLNIIFSFSRAEEEIEGVIQYNSSIYNKQTIKRILLNFTHLLQVSLFNVDLKLSHLDILSDEEKKQLLQDFNGNKVDIPGQKRVHDFLEDQAKAAKDRVAIVHGDRVLTFNYLNKRVNQLARFLQDNGIQDEQSVGILLKRSLAMVESILAVWKAGSMYIPLDSLYPAGRLKYILHDSQLSILLTDTKTVEKHPFLRVETDLKNKLVRKHILLDQLENDLVNKSGENLTPTEIRADAAYIIYTSGTTGKPKGVVVEHPGMMNHIWAKIQDLQMGETSVVAQNASHTFDISVWQFFAALLPAGKTIIYSNEILLEPAQFMERLAVDRVSLLEIVPSYLSVILDMMPPGLTLQNLNYLLVTGEEIKPHLVKKWFLMYPDIKMVNAYGPTEASDDITHAIMDTAPRAERIPIGTPLQNLNIYIVDENMQLCPIGVKGEILVTGVGVGRGYLNKPELTAEKFKKAVISHSSLVIRNLNRTVISSSKEFSKSTNDQFLMTNDKFSKDTNEQWPMTNDRSSKLYKTGDLARWLPDGNIEFFGRKDHQVKIRGFRIELEEIESELLNINEIKEAVVVDKDEGKPNKYLCAYLVTEGKLDISRVEEILSHRLPEYMLPDHFIRLERIPLTDTGKIDRKALPAPEEGSEYLTYITSDQLKDVVLLEPPGRDANQDVIMDESDRNETLSKEEKERILYDFNDTEMAYPKEKSFYYLFHQQAERTPGKVVYIFENSKITYRHLNDRANRLASLLRIKGVKADTIVGLMVHRSIEMMVGVLAITKAGGAYLPIDSQYPADRVNYMLKDSQVRILVTNVENPPSYPSITIDLNQEDNYWPESSNPVSLALSSDLAYVIYTSGTTGKPKGVMVEHRSIVNFSTSMIDILGFERGDKMLSLSTIAFDMVGTELFPPLIKGFTVVIGNAHQQLHANAAAFLMEREKVTIFQVTPSNLQLVLSQRESTGWIKTVRLLLVGAEKFPETLLEEVRELSHWTIYNLYGPTETTTWSTAKNLSAEGKLNVGKPIANTQVYILGEKDKVQPVDRPGELCIGGDGAARGYLNKPELTHEKFTANPFREGERVYRTGDQASWTADGNINFIGRADYQVQINGFRVELGEIESVLLKHDHIKQAVVVVKEIEDGKKSLHAYVVSEKSLMESDLREYLSEKLPLFMFPSHLWQLEKMPLTPNGKINRRILTALKMEHQPRVIHEAPADEVEEKLADIWSDILGIKKEMISTTSNFFDLGGHSLAATVLVARIHKELHVKIPLAEVFKTPSIKELSGYIKEKVVERYASIKPIEKKEYYALSSVQKRLYVLQQIESGNISYNIPQIIPLFAAIEPIKLENTFKKLIARHDSLRTSFEMIGETLVQRIHQEVDFAIEYYEARKNEGGDISNLFTRPFDLSQPPLLRVGMEKTVSSPPLLMVDMHHIITDGISQLVLQREFMSLYRDEELPSLRLQYKDYAHWHNSDKQQKLIKQQEEYWINMFSHNGELPVLNLPTDYSRPLRQSFAGSSVSFVLAGNEPRALKALSKEVNTTLFMTILSIYTILLSKLSDQEDIIVGIPIAARRHADLENIIGMFANTLAIRNYPSGEKTFKEFLIQVKERTLKAFENQEYPFEALVENVSIQRDISRNPIFDVMFNLLVLSESSDSVDIPGVDIPEGNEYVHRKRTSKFDLNLTAVDNNGKSLYFVFEYCTKLFNARTIERIIGYFRRIITLLSVNPELKLADLEIMTEEEKAKVLEISRGVEQALDIDQTIHGWFEDQAVKSPYSIALVMMDQETPVTSFLSYRELNARANQLAAELVSRGVSANMVVGLMVERSYEMIIGILAIMKAGGAYMPVDIEYPEARKEYMLKDSEIKLLLTNYRIEEKYDFIPGDLQVIDINDRGLYGEDGIKPLHIDHINRGSNLVYVIYTSGSTGNPKGVMLEHRNLVNLLNFQFNYTNIDCSRVLQFATISFDASFHEIFSALLSGGGLYLINHQLRGNIPGLFSYIEKNDIKTLFLPMSFLRTVFCEDEFVAGFPRCVSHIQTAGEQVMIGDKLRRYLQGNHVYLHNHYGPSETHVVTTLTLDPAEEIPDIPTIGKPILNSSIFILDKKLHLLPAGILGELYIGGVQVGRGYQGKEQLTVERFIANPFAEGERLYKTGDLALRLWDGNIEFLGRIDHQVKIRGFRIELGEIENRLLAHEKIKEAVVIANEQLLPNGSGEKYLSAYISTGRQPTDTQYGEITSSELRDYLLKSLPDYMIPSYFWQIDSMPLYPNGKVDRKALALHGIPLDSGTPYTAPQNDMEKKIAEVWKEVLHLEKVGIHDNYFGMGGDSLKAITIISRVHRVLNVEIPLVEFFNRPTIEQLAQYIESSETSIYRSIKSVEKKEYYVLSSAQVRLYVLQIIERESVGYNEPVIRILEGNLHQDRIQEVFTRLLCRHECLRTSIEMINNEPMQRVHDPSALEFTPAFDEAHEDEVRELITAFVKPFDMSKAPFLRVGLIKVGETRHVLIIDMHHIVTDGVSYEIFIKEALQFYNGEELPALRLQYKDYAEWQKSVLMKRQQEYWLGRFNGGPHPLDLPADYPRPPVRSFEGDRVTGVIGAQLTASLREMAHKKGATESIMLLALFNVLLAKYTEQEDIIVGMMVTGRSHSDLESIIGMFVNMLAMRNYPSFNRSFIDFLEEVKEVSVNALENQEYPFDTLVGQLKVNREAARNPLFDVVFQFNTAEPPARKNQVKKFQNMDVKPFKMNSEVVKFDLALSVDDKIKTMAFSFYYWSKLFRRETIENMSRHFENIVKEVVKDPGIKISAIKMLTEKVNKKKPEKVEANFNMG